MKIRKIAQENPILAILRGVPDDILLDYVSAIKTGGVNFLEIALNTKGALGQIALIKKTFPDMKIGAGTAITVDRAKAAMDAGAEFLLSPSTNEDVLEYCEKNSIAMMPGVFTPTDATICMRHGFYTLKLFPAGDMPFSYVKSLKGPLNETEYVAIGGVNKDNMAKFIKSGCIGVGLGSNILPKDAVIARDWETGAAYVKELINIVREAKNK